MTVSVRVSAPVDVQLVRAVESSLTPIVICWDVAAPLPFVDISG